MITIDFETRSDVDLTKVGAWKYSQDASTSILCLVYAQGDEEPRLKTRFITHGYTDCPKSIYAWIGAGYLFEAHNAFFEKSIWRNILVARYGWPDIPDDQWRCSASRAAACALPRALDKAGDALGLEVQKDMAGKRVMLKLCKPRKPTKHNKNKYHQDLDDYLELYEYCKDDVRSERCLSKALPPLSPKELRLWQLDQKINERGIRIDVPAVKKALAFANRAKNTLDSELEILTKGEVTKATQVAKLLKWVNKDRVVKVPSLQADQLPALIKEWGLSPTERRALRIRQLASKTSVSKYKAALASVSDDERLRDILMYCGASTGRWTGKRTQPHNFHRNDYSGDLEEYFQELKRCNYLQFEAKHPGVLDILSRTIRGIFIPTEGYTFFGGDYRMIEPCVLFWLAGDSRALKLIRDGKDIYVDLARKVYGISEDQVTANQRALGKMGVLGCGYQMWVEKFMTSAKTQWGLDINEELAYRVVTSYRNTYSRVPNLWEQADSAAKLALAHPDKKAFVTAAKNVWYQHYPKSKMLVCRLPSGRRIFYYDPQIQPREAHGKTRQTLTYMGVDSYTRRWMRQDTYGGKLVENITQAIARDIMAEAMVRCEDAGYQIVLTVHDELLTEKQEGSVKEFEQLMATNPDWSDGLPVTVEGWSGKRYLK